MHVDGTLKGVYIEGDMPACGIEVGLKIIEERLLQAAGLNVFVIVVESCRRESPNKLFASSLACHRWPVTRGKRLIKDLNIAYISTMDTPRATNISFFIIHDIA